MENFICNRYGEKLHILKTENIKICSRFLSYLLNICKKLTFLFPKVVQQQRLRWGGYCRMRFVAKFVHFPTMQNF